MIRGKKTFFIKTNIFIVTNYSGLVYAWKDIECPRVAAGLFCRHTSFTPKGYMGRKD